MNKQSTIYMQMLTSLGMVIGVILVLLSILGYLMSTSIALIITFVLTFGFRFVGYGLDRVVDKKKRG